MRAKAGASAPAASTGSVAAEFLRRELGPSVAAIIAQVDRLATEARAHALDDCLSDIDRIRAAITQLMALVDSVAAAPADQLPTEDGDAAARHSRLRHDLRSPLNAVKGYAELLVEDAEEDGREALVPELTKVVDQAVALLRLIDRFIKLIGNEAAAADAAALDPAEAVGNRRASAVVGHALRRAHAAAAAHADQPEGGAGRILVVDDTASDRDLVRRRLERAGHEVVTADNGTTALALVADGGFDLILVDMMMPGLNGFEVLQRLKADEATQEVPVIMISALDELDNAVRCIEIGALDFLPKPVNPVLLHARTTATLERKRLRERERIVAEQLRVEKELSDALLHHILPRRIVERIRRGDTMIADHFPEATMLFSDLVDFTSLSAGLAPEETVEFLDLLFSRFDAIAHRLGLEKIKTIGDGYMVAGGLPDPRPDHAAAIVEMAFGMHAAAATATRALGFLGKTLRLRIGIHSGPLVAGVIGTHKFVYDVWGDTVNTASRMEKYGEPGRIHVSAVTRGLLGDEFRFESRGVIEVKGKGEMETFFVERPPQH